MASDKALLTDLGLKDEFSLYAMFFQNQVTNSNPSRVRYFKSNLYHDCRVNPKGVFELYASNYEKTISIKKLNAEDIDKNKLRAGFMNLEVHALLKRFREEEDLALAEEILLKALEIKPGKGVHYFYNIFNEEHVLTFEKLRMVKKLHKNFVFPLRSKHIHFFCYNHANKKEELREIFENRRLPREWREKKK